MNTVRTVRYVLILIMACGLSLTHASSRTKDSDTGTLTLLKAPTTPISDRSYQTIENATKGLQKLHQQINEILILERLTHSKPTEYSSDLDVSGLSLNQINSQISDRTVTYNKVQVKLNRLNQLVDYKLYELFIAGITLGEVGNTCLAHPLLFKIARGQMYRISVECLDTQGNKLQTDFMLALDPYYNLRNLSQSIYPIHPFNEHIVKTQIHDRGLNNTSVSYHVHLRPIESISN